MTYESLNSYKTNGYLVCDNVLPTDLIDVVEAEAAQLFLKQIEYIKGAKGDGLDGLGLFQLMKILFNLDQTRYLSCLRLMPRLYSLQMLMMHPNVLKYINNLGISLPVMQSRIVFHVMSHQLKFQNGYFGFDAHQDWPSIQSSLDMVVVWIPLVDVDSELFPLEVIPGSHLKGLCSGSVAEHITAIDQSQYADTDFLKLPARRGDVVFMSGFTIHRSSREGRDEDVRLASSCRYENAMEEFAIAHSYPYCQSNVVKRDLIVDAFPSREQIEKTFRLYAIRNFG